MRRRDKKSDERRQKAKLEPRVARDKNKSLRQNVEVTL